MSIVSFKKTISHPLPFPEWSDTALNSEYWEPPKTKEKAKEVVPFEDDQNIFLPPSLASNVNRWKRATEVFKTERIVIYEDSGDYSNLAQGSKHLFHSEFVRHFVSSVGIMEFIGSNKTLSTEGVTLKFTPNSDRVPWRPWSHIYSLTKAGKGQKHKPLVNTTGKYIVRLFWMGCWRQITVDDKLPLDAEKNILLPSYFLPLPKDNDTEPSPVASIASSIVSGKSTKKPEIKVVIEEEVKKSVTVQIWPYILSKALLKIASLTWIDSKEIVDFDIISCLTGWIVQKIDTRGLTDEDKWEICRQFSNNFAWSDNIPRSLSGGSKSKSKLSTKSKLSSRSGSPAEDVSLFYLVGICEDLSCCEEDDVPELAPCCSHLFLIDQTRDVPLLRPESQPELEHWKRFRWLAWAIQKGLIDPPEDMGPIKCLKLISTLRQNLLTKESLCIKMSVEAVDDVVAEFAKLKQKGKVSPRSKDQKSIKSNTSGKSRKSRSTPILRLPDISIWCDFDTISHHIDYLHIYFKTSSFEHKTTITNMTEMEASVDPRVKAKVPSVIIHPQTLKRFRNEPLYIFVDSLDYKFLLFNLIQPGLTDELKKTRKAPSIAPSCDVMMDNVDRFSSVLDIIKCRRQISMATREPEEDIASCSEEMQQKDKGFSMGHIVVEDYNWRSERTSTVRIFLNSLGARSILTNLKEGRFCLRLWIETNGPYIVNILSDTEVTIGSLDVVLDSMETESHRLMNCCFLVSSAFGQLLQSLGTPGYAASLRKFYRCLLPNKNYNKQDLENIWNVFFEKLLGFLQLTLQDGDYKRTVTALRVLFLNTNIGVVVSDIASQAQVETIASFDMEGLTSEDILILKEIERAAVVIQAFFKRVYIRILKRRQSPSDKRYINTFDCLKKVYTACFNVEKRITICVSFLRDLLQRPNISKLFPWIKELKSVVKVETFNGSSPVTFANWIPICRYLFYCRNDHPVTAKICLFGEIEQYLIRVFDNDTGKEIPRHTYNCNTYKYFPNKKGYSVLCYGWTTTTTTTKTQSSWRLFFVTPRQSENELVIKDAHLETHTLTMGYIPNINQQIFSCNLTLNQDTLTTFRLCTSYDSSKLLLQCVRNNKVLAQICGNGNIILPAIFLECDTVEVEDRKNTLVPKSKRSSTKLVTPLEGKKTRESKSDRASGEGPGRISFKVNKKETVYTIEGFVLEQSWPLTVEEWEVVKKLKEKKLVGASTAPQQKLKERSNSRLTVDASLDKPFWCLQTVFNKGDLVTVVKDTAREEEIKDIKRTWYAEQPGRYAKSQNLRTDHIEDLLLDMHTNLEMSIESFSYEERTCDSPELMRNIKHNKNLLNRYSNVILSENELLDRNLQTVEHDEQEIAYREEKIQHFLDYQEKFQTDMDLFLQEQLERCSVLKMFITNCRAESTAMFDAIQEKRRQYVELVCPIPLPVSQKGKKKK